MKPTNWTTVTWLNVAIIGTFLFLGLAAFAGFLFTANLTSKQRAAHPFLAAIQSRQLLILVVGSGFAFLGNGFYIVKELLSVRLSLMVTQGPLGQINQVAPLDAFKKELRDGAAEIANRVASEAEDFFNAGLHDLEADRVIDASTNFSKSVSLVPTLSGYLDLGYSFLLSVNMTGTEAALQSGLQLARNKRDSHWEGHFLTALGNYSLQAGNVAQAVSYSQQGLVQLEQYGEPIDVAAAYGSLGAAYYLEGKYDECSKVADKISELKGRINESAITGMVHFLKGVSLYGQQDATRGVTELQQSLAIAKQNKNRPFQVIILALMAGMSDDNKSNELYLHEAETLLSFEELKQLPFIRGLLQTMRCGVEDEAGHLERAQQTCEDALKMEITSPLLALGLRLGLAYVYARQGKITDAEEAYNATTKFPQQALISAFTDARCDVLMHLARIYKRRGQTGETRRIVENVLTLSRGAGLRTDESSALTELGDLAYDEGNDERALRLYQEALHLDEAIGDIKMQATDFRGIASVFRRQGKHDDAVKAYEQVFLVAERQLRLHVDAQPLQRTVEMYPLRVDIAKSSDSRYGAYDLFMLADLYREQGKVQVAIEFYKAAMKKMGQSDSNRSYVAHKLCEAYRSVGNLHEAIKSCEENVVLARGRLRTGDEAPIGALTTALSTLSGLYYQEGTLDKALAGYEEILELHKKVDHPECRASAWHGRGNVLYRRGEWEQAGLAYREAAREYRRSGGAEREADALAMSAIVYVYQQKRSLALTAWKQADGIYQKKGIKSPWAEDIGRRVKEYSKQSR
jgi:tetratricopeptide (TPR) repeat protein